MTTKPKQFPTVATKAEIHKIYYKLPRRTIEEVIRFSIEKVNEESGVKYSLYGRVLNSRHIEIIKEELGDAPGYTENL